jgi:hypothetical protein
MTKNKIGKRKINGGEFKSVIPLEDEFALTELIRYQLNGQKIGAYLLRKNEQEFKVVFGFRAIGIPTYIEPENIDNYFNPLEEGLKDFPARETLTIHQGLFVNDYQRQTELDEMIKNTSSLELKYFLLGEKQKIASLTKKGLRKEKFLHLYVTFSVSKEGQKKNDPIEIILHNLENSWLKFTGELEQKQNLLLQQILEDAYNDGYQFWYNLIASKLGLDVQPLTTEELWFNLNQRFNQKKIIPLPQVINVKESELELEINSQLNPISLILAKGEIPVADRSWVHLQDKYVGVLSLSDKPNGWKDKREQLRFIWKVLAKDLVWDTEIICQLWLGNKNFLKIIWNL